MGLLKVYRTKRVVPSPSGELEELKPQPGKLKRSSTGSILVPEDSGTTWMRDHERRVEGSEGAKFVWSRWFSLVEKRAARPLLTGSYTYVMLPFDGHCPPTARLLGRIESNSATAQLHRIPQIFVPSFRN